jgi:hypothetical protein
MPRVRPKSSPFGEEDLCRSWQAFAFDTADGIGHTIPRGTRLRGSHDAVKHCPWNFVLDSEPDDEEPSVHVPYEEPADLFAKPTRVKLRPRAGRLLIGPHVYEPGQTFEAPAKVASWLVSENLADET